MNTRTRNFAKAAVIGAVTGLAVIGGAAAAHAETASPNVERQMINANYLNHSVDTKITLANGNVIWNREIRPGAGSYPTADFDGTNRIDVIDNGKVVLSGSFTYDCNQWQQCDWRLIKVDHNDIRYTWHTGNFGGFDFR